ncbi:hypothetical protein BHE74_00017663 [Ensete ventricosum]|nr:hypothetical protein BHE74_00017663 [Ensete ventricosum]
MSTTTRPPSPGRCASIDWTSLPWRGSPVRVECQPPWRRPVPAPDGRPADDKGAIGYGAGDGSGASEAAPERLGVIQARDVCRHPVETDLDRRCYWGADLEPA